MKPILLAAACACLALAACDKHEVPPPKPVVDAAPTPGIALRIAPSLALPAAPVPKAASK